MKRVKLRFAGLEVEFADRDRALQQVLEWAEKGTWHPLVVFGPEGCGKNRLAEAGRRSTQGDGLRRLLPTPAGQGFRSGSGGGGLVEHNLLVDAITYRDPSLWVDEPPPERDLELRIGKHVAWQTLLPGKP